MFSTLVVSEMAALLIAFLVRSIPSTQTTKRDR